MREICLVALFAAMSVGTALAQVPEYTTLETTAGAGLQVTPVQLPKLDPAVRELANRLFEAQWPRGKAPGGEWRTTASKKNWHEFTCLYANSRPDDFGRAKFTGQTIRVYVNADGTPERAEFRRLSRAELRALESFYPVAH